MPDIYVPGVKSRFETEKIISGLMEVEKIPRNRVASDNERLEVEKTNWQELGRRITAVRENARALFSHQNPFKESAATSSDPSVLDAISTRQAEEQSHTFTVKQIAKADRFMSNNLDKNWMIPAGNYEFSTGKNEVSFNYKGGKLEDFAAQINKRGSGKIKADVVGIKQGFSTLVIESLETGEENRLSFGAGAAMDMAIKTGIIGQGKTEPKLISIKAIDAKNINKQTGAGPSVVQTDVMGDVLKVSAMSNAEIAMNSGIKPTPTMILKIETAVTGFAMPQNIQTQQTAPAANTFDADQAQDDVAQTQTGNDVHDPSVFIAAEDAIDGDSAVDGKYSTQKQRVQGAVVGRANIQGTYDPNAVTAETEGAAQSTQNVQTTEMQQARVDNLSVFSLVFSDGTSADLPAIADSSDFTQSQYQLSSLSNGKTVSYLRVNNSNTHREVSIRNVHIFDPLSTEGGEALHPVAKAQDAIIDMDGISIQRPKNNIDDLIPGVQLTAKNAAEYPVDIHVSSDNEAVKDAVINFVGNYNRLMADLNVLTRNDESVINELTYLSKEEVDDLKKKLGVFSGDTNLSRFRGSLQQIVTTSYQTAEGTQYMLSDFGITTDARRGGGYDPSKLRGYLEIDEKVLDEAMSVHLTEMQQVFGRDTDGDLIIDSGAAYEIERTVKPYVELGGTISNKTSTIDTRIAANKRRLDTMDRQLASKEQSLKNQYGQMEGAYNRMEKMSNSLDQFGKQNKN